MFKRSGISEFSIINSRKGPIEGRVKSNPGESDPKGTSSDEIRYPVPRCGSSVPRSGSRYPIPILSG